jgi:asparagine synthase (glutamine-hydrolysing)
MCGIAGFAGRGDDADLRRMSAALAHRGPDAEGAWVDPELPVRLAHRRLCVVDPAGGAQPMWTADGAIGVVFNGEIYNHRALRAALEARGHAFRSDHSDTEVLLHGYREWGPELVRRLNGMWAFALLDRPRRRLLLSRDRFGQKPLYWARRPGSFAFASELSALLAHPELRAGLSETGLRKYFAYGYVPAPHTIRRGIHKLPAGCNLAVELPDGEPRVSRYWEFSLEPEAEPPAEVVAGWEEELRGRLERAVVRRLEADVPLGVFLSGGIDSSAVALVAARHHKPGELLTFSVGFDDPSFDESAASERVARLVGSRHHRTLFSPERARALWPEVAARLDEPLADPSLLPTHLLCGLARRHVTVALGGDGADELFAGYDPFRALRWAELYARAVPRPVHRAIRLLAARLPTSHRNLSLDFKLKRTLAGLSYPQPLWNPVWLAPLEPPEIAELLGAPVDPEDLYAEAIEAWERSAGLSVADRTLQFFTRLYLQDDILAKVDRASMMHGLELRSPYLDVDLVDLVRRIPASCKLRRGQTKWLLKRALAPWLPRQVRHRPKKGFGVPVGRWLQRGVAPFDRIAGVGGSGIHRERLAQHRAGQADHRLYLYAQWVLDRHRERWGEGSPA